MYFLSKKVLMFQHLHFYRTIPKLSTCFNCANVLTLPGLVLNVAGFILSNSNRPHKIFHLMSSIDSCEDPLFCK